MTAIITWTQAFIAKMMISELEGSETYRKTMFQSGTGTEGTEIYSGSDYLCIVAFNGKKTVTIIQKNTNVNVFLAAVNQLAKKLPADFEVVLK